MIKAKRYKRPTGIELIKLRLNSDKVCAICRNEFDGKQRIAHIDHDHRSLRTRGILCHKCNVGLGYFKDNPALLMNAADYIIHYRKDDDFYKASD